MNTNNTAFIISMSLILLITFISLAHVLDSIICTVIRIFRQINKVSKPISKPISKPTIEHKYNSYAEAIEAYRNKPKSPITTTPLRNIGSMIEVPIEVPTFPIIKQEIQAAAPYKAETAVVVKSTHSSDSSDSSGSKSDILTKMTKDERLEVIKRITAGQSNTKILKEVFKITGGTKFKTYCKMVDDIRLVVKKK